MIKIETLKELVRNVIFSGYVANEKPISIMIVGNVGIGKSELVKLFQSNDNLAFFTDVTYIGLLELLKDKKDTRHIIIPDFLKITMKKQSTTQNIVSALNALMEEGLGTITLMMNKYEFGGLQVGLITATTRDSYNKNKVTWKAMGLLDRMLIITYDYYESTKENIFEYILRRGYITNNVKERLEMPYKNIDVKLPYKLAKQLRDKETTFRKQKILQLLAMSRCIMEGRDKKIVLKKDIDRTNYFKRFMNLDYTKV